MPISQRHILQQGSVAQAGGVAGLEFQVSFWPDYTIGRMTAEFLNLRLLPDSPDRRAALSGPVFSGCSGGSERICGGGQING